MEPVRDARQDFFPLDEELGLQPGSLTPLQLEHLVHLALWMPFAKAVKLLADLLGVQVSEATGRRQTDAAGAADEGVQDEQASQLIEAKKQKSKKSAGGGAKAVKRKTEAADSKLLISSAGALVPLLKGEWAETKTLVIGEVKAKEKPCKHRPEQEVETVNLSYFSRLTDAETFGERAPVEMERRGVYSAQQVCAVQEGADWIQGFVDLHRPDAVRILDVAHASGYLTAIAELVKAAGTELSQDWLQTHLHALKHQGPTAVLQEGGRLLEKHPQVPDLQSKVNYLRKREQQMQYPRYQQQGWPSGSGRVESANKGVVQARLKGAGMRWERSHVHPMLSLRTAVCHDRWEEAWLLACQQRRKLGQQRRFLRQKTRWEAAAQKLQGLILRWLLLASRPGPKPCSPKSRSGSPAPTGPHRPAPNHPWRRRLLAKR